MESEEVITYYGHGQQATLPEKMQRKESNMLRIGQLKLEPNHSEQDLLQKIVKTLNISEKDVKQYQIKKKSIDARKKTYLQFVYTIDVEVINETRVLKKQKGNQVVLVNEKSYEFPMQGTQHMKERPIIIGSGPAGLFCAYFLAEHGYKPIVFERGASVEERAKDIE